MGEHFSYPLTPLPNEHAWLPGLDSRVPRRLMRLCTIFRPEHAERSYDEALALHDLCGLPIEDLAVLRPDRLALHEVLVQITADWSVQDGPRVADLGISFRHMVDTLLGGHIVPQLPALRAEVEGLRARLDALLLDEWALLHPDSAATPAPAAATLPWWQRARQWVGTGVAAPGRVRGEADSRGRGASAGHAFESLPEDELQRLAALEQRALAEAEPDRVAARGALRRVLFGIHHRHGRLWGDREVVITIARGLALMERAPLLLGGHIELLLAEAAPAEGYRRLPVQSHPIVMNTKGASASGKSTMRPLQQELAERLGVPWADFALISPDIWRKQLLDYASMGRDHKYAGACTGHEVSLIDHKLDRYMARKAELGRMSHLLIDRFRFDSFAPDSPEAGTQLLTRFGQDVYMFFMITPPEAIVERAWNRGLLVGRFKAVEDTLGHNVEAYAGIPPLFLRWALRRDKRVHFEFLDNTVALGERPRTVAFGLNTRMVVLDPQGLLDIERFRRVNVHASSPEELYPDPAAVALERCTAVFEQSVRHMREIVLADQATGRVWLHWQEGCLRIVAPALASAKLGEPAVAAACAAMFPRPALASALAEDADGTLLHVPSLFDAADIQTLGRWAWETARPDAPGPDTMSLERPRQDTMTPDAGPRDDTVQDKQGQDAMS